MNKIINQDIELLTQTRAKAVDGSGWVYGSYFYNTYPDEYKAKYNHKVKDGPVIITKKDGAIDIDSSTICRAVRVGDKVCHEGDYVEFKRFAVTGTIIEKHNNMLMSISKVEPVTCRRIVHYDKSNNSWLAISIWLYSKLEKYEYIQIDVSHENSLRNLGNINIIGNIIDNPEFMEVKR